MSLSKDDQKECYQVLMSVWFLYQHLIKHHNLTDEQIGTMTDDLVKEWWSKGREMSKEIIEEKK